MNYLLLIIATFFQIGCHSAVQTVNLEQSTTQFLTAERKPFRKSSAAFKSPVPYQKRQKENGKEYDPKPKVVTIDEKTGRYEMQWIGYDGKLKVVKYQRADSLEAVVEARVAKLGEAKFSYKYLVKNLPASPNFLSSFTVQTFAGDIKIDKIENVLAGAMTSNLKGFNEGTWWYLAIIDGTALKINPGQEIEFSLVSAALPGIVGCRGTAGNLTLKGVGEEMPQELENTMPGYEEWASCDTIGPVESLAAMNKSERAKYLADNLSKFQAAGWLSPDVGNKYEKLFKAENLTEALSEAKKDQEKQLMTSEVFSIIENLAL